MIGFLFLALALQVPSPLTVGGFVERLKIEGVQVEVAGLDLKAPLTEGDVIAMGESIDLHFTSSQPTRPIPADRVELLVWIFKPDGQPTPPPGKSKGPPVPFPGRRKGPNHSPHDPHDSHGGH